MSVGSPVAPTNINQEGTPNPLPSVSSGMLGIYYPVPGRQHVPSGSLSDRRESQLSAVQRQNTEDPGRDGNPTLIVEFDKVYKMFSFKASFWLGESRKKGGKHNIVDVCLAGKCALYWEKIFTHGMFFWKLYVWYPLFTSKIQDNVFFLLRRKEKI